MVVYEDFFFLLLDLVTFKSYHVKVQNSRLGTSPKIKGNIGIRGGLMNVQSGTGVPWHRLKDAAPFPERDYKDKFLIPLSDWQDFVTEVASGCDLFSIKEISRAAGYSDWRSFQRAYTKVGSAFHFVPVGPAMITTVTSAMAGIRNLRDECQRRLQASQIAPGYLRRHITLP